MSEKLLLIGPCPPPDGGTTIPFALFRDYVTARFSDDYAIDVISSTTGDKSNTSVFAPTMLARIVPLFVRIGLRGLTADKIVMFGSQRFITFVGSLVVFLFRPLGKRVFLRINGGGYDIFYRHSSRPMRFIIRNIMGKAEAIIVQTELVRSSMLDVWPGRVHSISNYRPLVACSAAAREFADDSIAFIYTGIVRKLKGCRELLDAYVALTRRLEENGYAIKTRLDFFGRHFDSAREPLDISGYRKYPDIVFHGQTSNAELVKHYAGADVFVFPTYWPTEGHPGAVVEAMMHGLPVISTDWRAMPEVIEDGKNGLFCAVRDERSLADAMYRVCIDPAFRRRLSYGALECALRYDHEIVCARLCSLLDLRSEATPVAFAASD